VVSNLPLVPEERETLRRACWQLIERPNVGYDFGAYRDAILLLGPKLRDLERLVLVNDLLWFPVGEADWIDDAERLEADLLFFRIRHSSLGGNGTSSRTTRP
jgi:lipopolysaccharide biosynthesis protein